MSGRLRVADGLFPVIFLYPHHFVYGVYDEPRCGFWRSSSSTITTMIQVRCRICFRSVEFKPYVDDGDHLCRANSVMLTNSGFQERGDGLHADNLTDAAYGYTIHLNAEVEAQVFPGFERFGDWCVLVRLGLQALWPWLKSIESLGTNESRWQKRGLYLV